MLNVIVGIPVEVYMAYSKVSFVCVFGARRAGGIIEFVFLLSYVTVTYPGDVLPESKRVCMS